MALDHSSSPTIVGLVVFAGLSAGANQAVQPLNYAFVVDAGIEQDATRIPDIHGLLLDQENDARPDYSAITALSALKSGGFDYTGEAIVNPEAEKHLSGAYLRDYAGE